MKRKQLFFLMRKKIKALMEGNDAYYYNAPKVKMYRELLKQGRFEVSLVAPREGDLYWIEGFHHVNAAIEEGMTLVPIGTSVSLAPQLKALVGAAHQSADPSTYDFSECAATVF
ncbi:hypothetical protein BVER_02694c [Candidatus Burkholderia verschuerenii]|uniref:Uncharacterized protein n=1 Tax=Candidatus Burkholderia verschuerenii TaxID=242163 RepID=A0A0L0M3Q5_9BURK|nr:hypothetical protein [Candidatus Burkholderia verschuerenii]KND57277.1 hypothetical protein BVER_02694c [Candidatus Burkholderia verschuerenii]